MADELRHLPLVEQAAKMAARGKALDLGAGRGNNAIYLAKQGFSVTAVEMKKTAIEELKINAQGNGVSVEVFERNIASFPIEESTYSLIVATNVLNFVSRDDFLLIAGKIRDGLAKGGLCVIVMFTDQDPMHDDVRNKYKLVGEREYENDNGRRWYFPQAGELKSLFDDGFEIVFYVEARIDDKRGHPGQEAPHSHFIARLIAKK